MFSTLLLKPCHKKQENYNENLATNFVDDQLDICKYNEFGWGRGRIHFCPVSLADMESAPTDRSDMESAPTNQRICTAAGII